LLELAIAKTTLMITHNLHMASRADEIICIADGQVKQQGTHENLMSQNGLYAELWNQRQDKSVSQAAKNELDLGQIGVKA
jgi:ABC-type multidrug transport system fused ATPase/permease subunit